MSLSVTLQVVDSEILYKEILHQLNASSSSKTTWIMVLHVTAIRRIFVFKSCNSQSRVCDNSTKHESE